MFFVTAYLGEPHGTAQSARDVARALLALHHDVHIVSPCREDFGSFAAGHQLALPTWHLNPRRRAHGPSWKALLNYTRDLTSHLAIKRAMERHLVIVNGWASYAYWKRLGVDKFHTSAIIIRESPRHFSGEDRPNLLEALLTAFSEFDQLIFVSDSLRVEWSQFPGLANKPTFYLPNCCEEESISPLSLLDRHEIRRGLGFGPSEFIIILPGTIEWRKGQDLVLNVWADVLSEIPSARLVLLGDHGTDEGRILIEAINMGRFGRRVTHIPAQPSALPYLYASDVLLFPSRAEAMPRTVLEAMAFGMPIVASNVDGIPELIEDEVSGLLFHLNDSVSMLRALMFVASNPDKCLRMGHAARHRYIRRFSRKHQIARLAVFLSNMAN